MPRSQQVLPSGEAFSRQSHLNIFTRKYVQPHHSSAELPRISTIKCGIMSVGQTLVIVDPPRDLKVRRSYNCLSLQFKQYGYTMKSGVSIKSDGGETMKSRLTFVLSTFTESEYKLASH
jgi:hypothetical protein